MTAGRHATLHDLTPALNARRARGGRLPVADWGPAELRNQAVGYAIARAAAVYVWPARRVGTLAESRGPSGQMLRIVFSDGFGWYPAPLVHPIPFFLRFKTPEEIEAYLLADLASQAEARDEARAPGGIQEPTDLNDPPGGHAA